MVKYVDVLLILIINCMHAWKELGVTTVRDQSHHYCRAGAAGRHLMMMTCHVVWCVCVPAVTPEAKLLSTSHKPPSIPGVINDRENRKSVAKNDESADGRGSRGPLKAGERATRAMNDLFLQLLHVILQQAQRRAHLNIGPTCSFHFKPCPSATSLLF